MCDWAVTWCEKPNVQYWMSYPQRNMVKIDGITYFDCSAFTFFAMWLGGGMNPRSVGYSDVLTDYTHIWYDESLGRWVNRANAWTVTPMENALKYLGWERRTAAQGYTPKAGDIMVKIKAHTEICYKESPFTCMGARTSSLPPDEQVSIHGSTLGYWDCWYHLPQEEPPTPPEPEPPVPPPQHGKKMNIMLMLKPYWKYGFY